MSTHSQRDEGGDRNNERFEEYAKRGASVAAWTAARACVRTVSGPASRKQDGGRGDERAAQKQELFFRFPTLPRARSSFLRVIATLPLATLFGLAERGRLCFDRIARVLREEGALFWIAGSLAGSVSGPLVLAPWTRADEAVNSAAAAICGALALLRGSPRYLHRWPELAACGRGGRRESPALWGSRFAQRGLREAVQGPSLS